MKTADILRTARTTGDTIAAIDHLLAAGYDFERACRACRLAGDVVDEALWRLPLPAQEAAEQAAADAASDLRLDREARPLAWRLVRAEAIRDEYETRYDECTCDACGKQDADKCTARLAYERAERIVELVRADLRDSDEPREYEIWDANARWTITSTPDALETDVEESVRDADWGTDESWVWDGRSRCETTGEEGRHEVTFESVVPSCTEDEHDWGTPHSVLGGLRDNPGVQGGPNGGITARSVCAHCGVYRVFVSRKTNPSDGSTYEATDYEPADEDSLEWVASQCETEIEAAS